MHPPYRNKMAGLSFTPMPRGKHKLVSTTNDSSPTFHLPPMEAPYGLSRTGFGGRDLRHGERATLALKVDKERVRAFFGAVEDKAKPFFEGDCVEWCPAIRGGNLLRVKVDVEELFADTEIRPGETVQAAVRIPHTWSINGRAGLVVVAAELKVLPPAPEPCPFTWLAKQKGF